MPTARETQSWASIVGSDSGSGSNGFLSKSRSRQFSLDNLTAVLHQTGEAGQAVDQLLPFPLDRIDQNCEDAYEILDNMRKSMLHARRNGIVTSAQKKLIERNLILVKKLMAAVKHISIDMGRLKL